MTYQTRECSISGLLPELAKSVNPYLSNNDKVLICYETRYDAHTDFMTSLTVGRSKPSFYAAIITQVRVISASHDAVLGKYQDNAHSMQLTDIVSVSESQHSSDIGNSFAVTVHGQGNVKLECSFGSKQASQRFADILKQLLKRAEAKQGTASTVTPASVEERLRVLVRLHNDGLVSDEEFQRKRNEILGQL